MAIESFEVQDIKCIDDDSGNQGLVFMGSDKMVTIVLERDSKGHNEEICALQNTLWNAGRRPITMFIQDI